jgi:hypothetical protein
MTVARPLLLAPQSSLRPLGSCTGEVLLLVPATQFEASSPHRAVSIPRPGLSSREGEATAMG